MSERNKLLATQFFEEIFNRHNMALCDEIIAEEYSEWAEGTFGQPASGVVNGPAHVRFTAVWLLDQFPDLQMTIEAMVAEGDSVACRIRAEGTNLGTLQGVLPPTGKHFSARQSHWFRVKENKLAEHWATREDLLVMVQLGVINLPRVRQADSQRGSANTFS